MTLNFGSVRRSAKLPAPPYEPEGAELAMAESAPSLLPIIPETEPDELHPTGLLPAQHLRGLLEHSREIEAIEPIEAAQIQPASLDLRLGGTAYRVRASFLPGRAATVQQKIEALAMHRFELGDEGAVLEKGCVYIVELMERLCLKRRTSAVANPKSSIGRLDVFTRVIADGATAFDRLPDGYKGPLYAEIAPRTFSISVREGSRLCQLRVRRGSPTLGQGALERLQDRHQLVESGSDAPIIQDDQIGVTLDLTPDPVTGVIGFRARKHTDVIDVEAKGAYDAADF